MYTVSVEFNRKKRYDARGCGAVEVRVTCNRKNQYMSTGVRVGPKEWRFGQVINRADADVLNNKLAAIVRAVEAACARCLEDGRPIVLKEIKNSLMQGVDDGGSKLMGEQPSSAFFEWLKDTAESFNIKDVVKGRYANTIAELIKFGKIRTWADCSVENVYAFDGYLHAKTTGRTGVITDSGVYNYHKCMKALLNRAVEVGKLQQNPYNRLRGKFKKGEKENVEYLLESEVKMLMELPLDNRLLIEARDLFVFQCYTGLAYADAEAFTLEDYRLVDGRWECINERIKTGVPYVSVLLPPAVAIIERYGGKAPHINNAEYNQRLKLLQVIANIKIHLHSHLGRHTFATMMLSKGVKIEHVSKMLGHTNITQTQRYAKVLAKDVKDAFRNIDT